MKPSPDLSVFFSSPPGRADESRRSREPRASFRSLLFLAAILLLTSPALAQRLNLDTVSAPAAGTGSATLTLADSLDKQIEGLKKLSGTSPSARVSIALRQVARDLLRAGEQAGETGSPHVLLGRTLSDNLASLDALVADRSRFDTVMLDAIARDLDRPATQIPRDINTVDRWLRDALAPLVQAIGVPSPGSGWFEPHQQHDKPASLVRWAAGLQITDPLREAIATLDERLRAAQEWIAYAPSARRIVSLVREAAEPLQTRPAWMSAQVRSEYEQRLVEAIQPLTHPPEGAEPPADPAFLLRRIARLARVLDHASSLEDNSPAVRDLRLSLLTLLKLATPSATEERRLTALDRALELTRDRRELEKDAGITRQLRPALRALTPAARESESAMLAAIVRLVTEEGATSDPAVLNAVSAHQRRIADLRLIADINRHITSSSAVLPGEKSAPTVIAEFKGLADWIFAIGQDLNKAGQRDLALIELREVASGAIATLDSASLRRFRGVFDPVAPRAATAADTTIWNEVVGDKGSALLKAADQTRTGLLAAWTAKDVPRRRAFEQRAAQINRALDAITDIVALRVLQRVQQSGVSSSASANIQQWPGWELSSAAIQAASDDLPSRARALVDRLLIDDPRAIDETLRKLQDDFAVALLAGRLEFLATQAGQRAARPGSAAALHELGLGAPDPDLSWMAAERADLAAIGRYTEEWAALVKDPKSKDRAAAIRSYVNGLAAKVRERLGPPS